jgi:hypothetical protein
MSEGILIILAVSILPVLVGYLLFRIWPRSGKMGINTKTVHCPCCGQKAPILRKFGNLIQVLWGGWTCEACKCEFDKYGNEVNT